MYREKYHVLYCDRSGREYRLGIQEWDYAYILERRGHFNDVAPSEIGLFKEGFDFDFLQIGDTLIVSDSTVNNGTYTVTGFSSSVPPDTPYIRIQLSPQVPVQIHEEVTITIIPQSVRHKAATVPFTVYEETTSELKIGGIYPSRAELRLLSSKTFNMEELYTADERKYYVTHEPTDGSDYGKWYGFIIPNGFSEEMDNDVHYMILTASDNLGVLGNVPFLDPATGENYGYESGEFLHNFIWYAKEALRKTGVILPIWTLVDVKPQLPSQSVTVNKSVQFFEDVIGDNGAISFTDTGQESLLQVGTVIEVEHGSNHGAVLTVVSWDLVPYGFPTIYRLDIEVSGDITQHFNPENVILHIYTPTDIADISDPLDITYQDARTFINDHSDDVTGVTYVEVSKNAMSTFEVLNNMAKVWNVKIHQNNGRWEIVRWNAYRQLRSDYQYFRYNAEGTYIGRAPFMEQTDYPCENNRVRDRFRPFGHEIYMDRVFKRVSVNYLYKYKLDGDSLVNMIRNGNFGVVFSPGFSFLPPPVSTPAQFTPQEWVRKKTTNSALAILLIQQTLSPPAPGVSYPPGISSFITISGVYNDQLVLSSDSGYPTPVNAGDKLKISWWQSLYALPGPFGMQFAAPLVIRVKLSDPNNTNTWYTLVNSLDSGPRWQKFEGDAYCFVQGSLKSGFPGADGYFSWEQVFITVPPAPIDGNIQIEIVGVAGQASNSIYTPPNLLPTSFRAFIKFEQGENGSGALVPDTRRFASYPARISGVFVGKIVDPNNDDVPTSHGYYFQQNGNYTDSIPEIEVLSGDDRQDDVISNVMVRDRGNMVHIKSWDSWLGEFGWSALGLLLAKSVMQLYYRPMRLIDGQFVAPNLSWDSRISFEVRPGELYAPLRGGIDYVHNRFEGTLAQVIDDNIPALPDGGGVDAGDDVTPNWQITENSRCVRNSSGINTGEVEVMEADYNPASQTFGQTRWVVIGEDTDSCPIGAPLDLLWGSQETLDANALSYFPITKSGDEYTVNYSNDGGPGYLRLLHRSALGTVKSITYQGGYESISGWVYEADLMINGYLYKHMRLSWLTGVYDGLPVTFKIN